MAGLEQMLSGLGLEASPGQMRQLEDFIRLLQKWNRVYNLVGQASTDQLQTLHLADSLAIRPYLSGETIADVGSGAGFPGLPLAIMSPQLHFTLIDSNSKKTRFLTQAVIELGLDNVRVFHGRCQDFPAGTGFDTVTARAFAALAEAVGLLRPLLASSGQLLLMKARQVEQELQQLAGDYDKKIVQLQVPGLSAERNIVILRPLD